MSVRTEPVANAPAPAPNHAATEEVEASFDIVRRETFEMEDPGGLAANGRLIGIDSVSVRHGFIRKVYSIVCIQLLITVVIGAVIMANAESLVKALGATGIRALFYSSMAITLMCICAFYCCEDLVKTYPRNYILLLTFTVFESIMVGFICTLYTGETVLLALGTTCIVVLALTCFACQTKYDFTGLGPYLFGALIVLSCLGLILSFTVMSGTSSEAFQPIRILYASLGALVMCMYIVYDTQLIVGGKHHKNNFSEDDYVIAAISLYIDIVELFLYLLELFDARSSY